MGSKRRIFSATKCVLAVQGRSGSSKVDDFGTNRKRVCDFLLVRHCDYGPILHRFWDTATYWLNIAFFLHLSHSVPSLPMFPLEFRAEVNHEETRVMGLSCSEEPMIVAWIILTQCQRVRTDRQTDGFTIACTALCIAICWCAVKIDVSIRASSVFSHWQSVHVLKLGATTYKF